MTFKYLTANERCEFLKESELLRCEAGEKIIGQGDITGAFLLWSKVK